MKWTLQAGTVFLFFGAFLFAQTTPPSTERKPGAAPGAPAEQKKHQIANPAESGPVDILSDTMGVDFGPYLQGLLETVKKNWYDLIPAGARPPIMKKGKVVIEFAILKDGQVSGLQRVASSGDVTLDRAAWGGITASSPFPPLPSEFGGQYLALRFYFVYNCTEDCPSSGKPGVPGAPLLFSKAGDLAISPSSAKVVQGAAQQFPIKGTASPITIVNWTVTGSGCTGEWFRKAEMRRCSCRKINRLPRLSEDFWKQI